MKSTTIYRLLKAGLFIFVLIVFGLAEGTTAQIFFAITLAIYLIELYRKDNKYFVGVDTADGVETIAYGHKKKDKIIIDKIKRSKK